MHLESQKICEIHEIHGNHKCIFRKDTFKSTMDLMDLTSVFIWIWNYDPVKNGSKTFVYKASAMFVYNIIVHKRRINCA